MQTKTIKTKLIINGQEVLVGHQFLEDIVYHIPDVKENESSFEILASSDNPEVREKIANKDNLNKKTIKKLLNDTSEEVVDCILNNKDAAKYIKQKDLLKIIKTDNIKHLVTIASRVDNYEKCDLCKIIKILANHKNRLVRYNLLKWKRTDIVTPQVLNKLANDKDIDVANEAKEALKKRK